MEKSVKISIYKKQHEAEYISSIVRVLLATHVDDHIVTSLDNKYVFLDR